MGVDAIMDMGRTSINVTGNCLACCVMARTEGSFRGLQWKMEEEERRRRALQEQQPNTVLPTTTEYEPKDIPDHDQQQVDEQVEIMVHKGSDSTKSFDISPSTSHKDDNKEAR